MRRLIPLLLAWMLPAPAWAADCTKPLKLVTSLPMTDADNSGRFNVPVVLDGIEKHFLFDTGGFIPQVSPHVASELKLQPHTSSTGIEIYGADGSVSKSQVTLPSFAVGPLHVANYDVMLGTDDHVDGIFVPAAYRSLDFEIDFSSRKVNLFLNDHCEGQVIYWPAKTVAVVPVSVDRDFHLTVPVTVDGHELTAIIDTGASTSTIRQDIAQFVFKIDQQSPDMKVIGHLSGDEKAPIYSYPFKTLSFEGITVQNPKIVILTDVVNKNTDRHDYQTGSLIKTATDDLKLPEVIIGMDVLKHLHLYLALTEKKLYLTDLGTPASAAPAATTPAETTPGQ